MANFAKVSNGIVENVIVISNIDCDNLPFPESEPVGQAYIASLGLEGDWLQTSYNNNFRGNYAGINYSFDASIGEYGEFVPPVQPA
jgi:hypothetical protein